MNDMQFQEALRLAAAKKDYRSIDEAGGARLRSLGIDSKEELVSSLATLQGDDLLLAIEAVELLKVRRAGPILVHLLPTENLGLRARVQLALQGIRSKRSYPMLADVALHHSDVDLATAACYSLSFMFRDSDDIAPLLLRIFDTTRLDPRIRAQAAEGFGNHLSYTDRRRRMFKSAAAALIEGLAHPDPELRFWCCFALGQMRARQAIPALTKVAAEDQDFCPGWWLVCEEASDALLWIAGKSGPHRDTLGWTETGPKVPPGFDEQGRRIG